MPQAERGLPPCPKHLKDRAHKTWQFLAEQLELSNMAYRPDGPMLEVICVNYARAVEAELQIAKEGAVLSEPIYVKGVRTEAFRLRKNPYVVVANAAWACFGHSREISDSLRRAGPGLPRRRTTMSPRIFGPG